ncbi:hypothetical protein [Aureimonas sp. D3]|uniref:hypothetical protein n=1 Tax=Aureimonas sp. D3 TaxID=1638164 RepID=UPI000781EB30|nr:hypothetical protein [Aureimonas sp. D3]
MSVVCDGRGGPDPFELAERDGAGCLAFLLGSAVVGIDARVSVGAAVRSCGFGNPAQRALRAMGVVVRPAPSSAFVAIAAAHPELARLFAPSLWCAGWTGALMRLPGACGGERMSFGRVYSPAILVPRALIEGGAAGDFPEFCVSEGDGA